MGCLESKNLIKQLSQVFESAFQGDFSVQVLAYAFQGGFLYWTSFSHSFPITHSLFFSAMSPVMSPPPSCSPGSVMQDYFQGECLYTGHVHEKWVIYVVFKSCSADSGHIFVFVFVASFWKNPKQIFKGVLLRLELLIHLQITVRIFGGGRRNSPPSPTLPQGCHVGSCRLLLLLQLQTQHLKEKFRLIFMVWLVTLLLRVPSSEEENK